MEAARLFVLLSSLWSGGIGLYSVEPSWTAPEGESSQNVTSASVAPNTTEGFQLLPTARPELAEIAPIPEEGTSEETLLQSALPLLESSTPAEGVGNQTPAPTEMTEEGTVKSQNPALRTQTSTKFNPGAKSVVLSNSTLRFLQSFASTSKEQTVPQNLAGGMRNRSPRKTYLSDQSQGAGYQKSSFETTRGKNWCAYVHTRLSPTVVLDPLTTYVPGSRSPCGWTSGSCAQRSQKVSNPVYRMQHKIVTSLDWRCCPGYSGLKCQLKGLKSKSFNDLVTDIVREQFKIFQNDMQETVAQLFKTVSSLSEDLENTRQLIKQVNESVISATAQQKSVLIQENRPTLPDIVDLKNHIVDVRHEMTFTCEKPIKELEAKQIRLEDALAQERSRSLLYYESLNQTLSKMKEVHEQLLSDQKNVPAGESVSSNVTEYMSTLKENMKKHSMMLLQMFHDLHIQDSKINNLTITVETGKEFVRGECEDLLSKCRNDFKFQLRDTEENLHVLNQTLAEVLFPMDSKMNQMSEQLNDLTYDMEILQPLLEQGASLRQTMTYEQPKEAAVTRKRLENLTNAVNSLNFLVKELTKRHTLLRNEVQSRGDTFERRINEYALEMEDGLNKTMTVINNAIDFIQDNYVLKETLSAIKYNPEIHDKCTQNMETIFAFISQFQRLNDSIEILVNDNQKYDFVLQVAKALAYFPKDEKLGQLNFQKLYQMFNETTSQMAKYQQNMSHLEEKILLATKISKHFETKLQEIESKVTQTLIPYYISLKKGSVATNDRDQALQLQVLNSRFKALEAKSIRLSINFSLLNKTLNEVLIMCHGASTNISELNATIPKWIKGSLPDIHLLQKALTKSVEPIIEIKTQAALSNLTWYIDRSLSGNPANAARSQKQVKSWLKKPNTLKKPTVNVTTVLIGRTQRNTDNIISPAPEEYSGCRKSPCQNGGTCINGRTSFTCACRHPFTGDNCTIKLVEENALPPDFSKGSYRYAPMVAFFVSHTYGMTTPGPILFNDLDVNYGASYTPRTGKFRVPYLGVYVFKYTIESLSAHISGFLVVDGRDKLAFESENINSEIHCDRVLTGDALLELNYGQEVWLRLVKGTIPAKIPPVTTFSGYLLYRT
uniref:Multimerin-1 n=1 Tax=Oryctolagus cuniculus TaxID=9986 RepID=A0A5F9C4D1_RABIT